MRKKEKYPKTLKEVLGPLSSRLGLKERVQEMKIGDLWEKAVGKALAERTEPARLKDRILFVKVENSVWMQQLHFLKEVMMQKINEHLKENFIIDLRFFIGEITRPQAKREEGEEPADQQPGRDLDTSERQRIEKEIGKVRDRELQEILLRIYQKKLKARKNP